MIKHNDGGPEKRVRRGRGPGIKRRTVRIQDHLAQAPLFSELLKADLDLIASGTTEARIARGGIVFHRGEPCTGFHIVVYGQVKLMLVSSSGVEKVVRLIGPGDSFGEAVMFIDENYIVTAQALVDTLLLHVGRKVLCVELEHHPQLACKMLAGLSRRLHSLMGDVEAYTLNSGTQRVIGYLLKDPTVCEGNPFRLEAKKGVIASRLSLTQEHFSRILHNLADNHLIHIKAREITVLDMVALANYRG